MFICRVLLTPFLEIELAQPRDQQLVNDLLPEMGVLYIQFPTHRRIFGDNEGMRYPMKSQEILDPMDFPTTGEEVKQMVNM